MKSSPSWWNVMRQNFPWRQFSIGSLIPMAIFYNFQHFHQPLTGAFFAGGWGAGVTAITYWRSRQINIFAALAVTLTTIEVIGTLLTRNPSVYLASAAVDRALYGVLFLASLFLPRSLIQIFAEAANPDIGSEAFRRSRAYRSAWQILTAMWGVTYLLTATVLIFCQLRLSIESFLIVRTISGMPLFVAKMGFSYWFPGWYWNRLQKTTKGAKDTDLS